MARRGKRWMLNLQSGLIHDRLHLRENCNSDQVTHQRRAHNLGDLLQGPGPAARRRCRWCLIAGA